MKFIPDPGTLFMVHCTRTIRREVGSGDKATLVRTPDRSYDTTVFLAVANDQRAMVADIVVNDYEFNVGKRCVLLHQDFNCLPVGPEVVKALGLDAKPALQSLPQRAGIIGRTFLKIVGRMRE